ncbi:MAG: hypothetical protein JWN43_4104 [Gammaproteobacteria bacterium]|nr:hypothetical protein [Gammaproteobacteria bacterium]
MSVGTLLGAVGLVRIQVLIRRAHSAHPQEMEDLLARLGYSEKSVESSLMIVGYQYAVLRRPFLEMSGTSPEREKSALLLWFAVMFTGVALGVAGIAMEVLEA